MNNEKNLDPQENPEVKKRLADQGKNLDKILTKAQKDNMVPLPVGTTLVMGATKSGKSNLVAHLLTSDQCFKNQFSELHIMGMTCDKIDPTFAVLKDKVEDMGTKVKLYSDEAEFDETIHNLIEKQKSKLKRHQMDTASRPICIWLDDISNCTRFVRESKELKTLSTMSRHVNICCILNMHKYKLVSPIFRNNAWFVIMMNGCNQTEIKQFASDFAPTNMSEKDYQKIVEYCLDEPYSFCFVNRMAPLHERTRKKFSQIIETGSASQTSPSTPGKE